MKLLSAAEPKVMEIIDACEHHGERSIILLSGVAGTGKSLMALAAAQRFTGHPLLVKEIQFHQGFTYEDFIEGFRPTTDGGFVVRDGIFLQANDAARRDLDNRYVLLIEELSRANVTAVLGELMTYLEHRDRDFTTPITRRKVRVAKNLVLIGTMNPRDRSVLELDEAMFRRVRIVECHPDTAVLRQMVEPKMGNQVADTLVRLFEEIQRRHPQTYTQLMPFGHGIFAHADSERALHELWHQRLKHFLYRPLTPPHRYAEDIAELYPWREVTVPTMTTPAAHSSDTNTPGTDEPAESSGPPDSTVDEPPTSSDDRDAG